MEKCCSKCKRAFGCENEAPGCWCEEVKLTHETLALLKANFENCLCPACLATYQVMPAVTGE